MHWPQSQSTLLLAFVVAASACGGKAVIDPVGTGGMSSATNGAGGSSAMGGNTQGGPNTSAAVGPSTAASTGGGGDACFLELTSITCDDCANVVCGEARQRCCNEGEACIALAECAIENCIDAIDPFSCVINGCPDEIGMGAAFEAEVTALYECTRDCGCVP